MPLLLVFIALMALLVACGGPPVVPSESPLDLAASHYRRGMQYLDMGQLRPALEAFERADALEPSYPGGKVGKALVAAVQGDFWATRKELKKTIHQDNDFVDAFVVQGRVAVMEGLERDYSNKAWLDEALRAFNKAIRLAPEKGAGYYYSCYAVG